MDRCTCIREYMRIEIKRDNNFGDDKIIYKYRRIYLSMFSKIRTRIENLFHDNNKNKGEFSSRKFVRELKIYSSIMIRDKERVSRLV